MTKRRPDPKAPAADDSCTIQTYPSGSIVDYRDPAPDSLVIEDQAHALSIEPRFGGHTPWAWPVAGHCLFVSFLVERDPDAEPLDALRGLGHDAAEAYLKDLPGPLKRLPELREGYRTVEARFNRALAERWGVGTTFDTPAVKRADKAALALEQAIIRRVDGLGATRLFERAIVDRLEELYVARASATLRVLFLQRYEQLRARAGL